MWLRIDDNAAHHPKFMRAGTTDDDRNRIFGSWARLALYAAQYRTDGYVNDPAVRSIGARPDDLVAMRRVRLLHFKGDRCKCRAGREWPDDAALLLHDFLDRNPSRAENDVHRAKRRELRNPELKAAVRERDGGRCRYCGIEVNYHDHRSSTGGVIDHVDPALAEGARNLATACRSCNSVKGKRTPEAAGMRLWPAGTTPETIAAALAAELAETEPTHDQTHDRPVTGSKTVTGSATDPVTDPDRTETPSMAAKRPPDPPAEPPPTGVWLAAHEVRRRRAAATRRATDARVTPDDPNHAGSTTGSGRGGHATDDAGDAGPSGARPRTGPATDRHPDDPGPYGRPLPLPDMPSTAEPL